MEKKHPPGNTGTITDASPGLGNRLIKAIMPSTDTAVKLLAWSGVAFLLMMVLIFYERPSFFPSLLGGKERSEQMARLEALRKRDRLKDQMEERPNLNAAVSWLKKIKFQQSFTTGWSGALKLPFALEGSLNKAITFAERQMSYPEIIAAFRDYLQNLQLTYSIVIGIDELDKLESNDTAQEFLNEIKSIFGIPNCFFLISVSENAMSNFERRGMPFRDVFDSSFDSVVYVENFSLADAATLLKRRVIGNPMAFFCLAYCFAGGLPRDIIRYFREIVRISQHQKTIKQITDLMIADDTDAKLRAIIQSLNRLPETEEGQQLLAYLFELKDRVNSISTFTHTIGRLAALNQTLQNKANSLSAISLKDRDMPAIDTLTKLLKVSKEFHAYLCYTTTLMDLFTINVNQQKIKQIEADKVFDELAKARQALSIDQRLALEQINSCRRKEALTAFA